MLRFPMATTAPNIPCARPRRAAQKGPLRWAGAVLALALVGGAAEAQGRADQVFVINRGAITPVSGTVKENSLTRVVLEQGERNREFDSSRVVRVALGRVPVTHAEGRARLAQGDAAAAAASFRLAAADNEASAVARADARRMAAQALLIAAQGEASGAREAAQEARRFLTDHPNHRDVPEVRALEGRALWLAGDAERAAEALGSLFREAESDRPTTGYDLVTCLTAGLEGAHAALAARSIETARGLFSAVESRVATALAQAEPGDTRLADLLAIQAGARLGEGYLLLAENRAPQAATYFRSQVSSAGGDDRLRLGAGLGLALALEAQGGNNVREAQVEFARFSALAHRDPLGSAAALVGLARTARALGDRDARERARQWLELVLSEYPTAPAAVEAQALLRSL